MNTEEIISIADAADMIVDGYAFTRCDLGVSVLNLADPTRAVVLDSSGNMLETTMDDLELEIVCSLYERNAA